MKIALDAMGGDYAPQAIVEGALLACEELPPNVEIVLIGRDSIIQDLLHTPTFSSASISVVHADDVIEMGEHPTKAFSQKTNSSIALGFGLLKQGHVDAFCSAGNTGAMLVGAMFSVKAIDGVQRPSIASLCPQEDGTYGVILDVGANADCKPEVLEQFAELGSVYAKSVLEITKPRVGLVNLGQEEQKGTILTQATHQLLKNNARIHFIGNIEGRDIFTNKADVIVCDGFTGNVVLKMAESFYEIFHRRGVQDEFMSKFNYEAIGGSPVLGVNGNVVIGHGLSSPLAVKSMLFQAKRMVDSKLHIKIKQAFNSQQ